MNSEIALIKTSLKSERKFNWNFYWLHKNKFILPWYSPALFIYNFVYIYMHSMITISGKIYFNYKTRDKSKFNDSFLYNQRSYSVRDERQRSWKLITFVYFNVRINVRKWNSIL